MLCLLLTTCSQPLIFYTLLTEKGIFGETPLSSLPYRLWRTHISVFAVNDHLPHELPEAATLRRPSFTVSAALTASLLSLISTRIGIGNSVALAKLYDASDVATTTSSAPNATLCAHLATGDVKAIRDALTVPAQVASVQSSVANKTMDWPALHGRENVAEWVLKVVGLFNM